MPELIYRRHSIMTDTASASLPALPGHAGAYRGVSGISEQAAPARLAAIPSSGWGRATARPEVDPSRGPILRTCE